MAPIGIERLQRRFPLRLLTIERDAPQSGQAIGHIAGLPELGQGAFEVGTAGAAQKIQAGIAQAAGGNLRPIRRIGSGAGQLLITPQQTLAACPCHGDFYRLPGGVQGVHVCAARMAGQFGEIVFAGQRQHSGYHGRVQGLIRQQFRAGLREQPIHRNRCSRLQLVLDLENDAGRQRLGAVPTHEAVVVAAHQCVQIALAELVVQPHRCREAAQQ